MPTVTKTEAVSALGVGRPDFSGEQWQARTLARVELHENEALKGFYITATAIASPYPWVVAPLAIGVPTYLIDGETGFPMPYTVVAGYALEVVAHLESFNQNHRLFWEFEGFEMAELYSDALINHYDQHTLFDTRYVDPDATFPHVMAFGGENVGVGVMRGFAEVACILRCIHTEIPTTKTIRCKYCENTAEVALGTVKWNCTRCGKLNMYLSLPRRLLRGGTPNVYVRQRVSQDESVGQQKGRK